MWVRESYTKQNPKRNENAFEHMLRHKGWSIEMKILLVAIPIGGLTSRKYPVSPGLCWRSQRVVLQVPVVWTCPVPHFQHPSKGWPRLSTCDNAFNNLSDSDSDWLFTLTHLMNLKVGLIWLDRYESHHHRYYLPFMPYGRRTQGPICLQQMGTNVSVATCQLQSCHQSIVEAAAIAKLLIPCEKCHCTTGQLDNTIPKPNHIIS